MTDRRSWRGVVREIDPRSPADPETVARLHRQLLNWGPVAKLGDLLLKRFFYSRLVRDELITAALYEVNGRPAGFVAYTPCSIRFHREAVKKHWAAFSYYIFLSLIRNPLVAPRFFNAFQLARSRRSEAALAEDPLGEILAIGVLPEFSRPSFIRESGLKISLELFEHAVGYFKAMKIKRMRLLVDDFNKPALYFYHGLGGRFERYQQGGYSMYQIWFDV